MTIELITSHHIEDGSRFAAEVHDLLDAAFPEGAPNELAGYYARHGFPTATLLLSEERHVIGHLAIYEREIGIGAETVLAGLLGEVAVAADRTHQGLARRLVRSAHEHFAGTKYSLLDPVRLRYPRVRVQRLQAHPARVALPRRRRPLENAGLPRKHGRGIVGDALARSSD